MKNLLIIVLMASSFEAFSWGKIGHRIVGEIGEKNLSRRAKREVRKILGHETLSQVSNWPDFMRSSPNFDKYGPWHYVSIPDGSTYKKSEKNLKGDALTAMAYCEKVLRNNRSSLKDKQFALKFLVHLVGDIHQPLHVGRSHDHGGNKIKLKWFGKDTNLHKIWDEDLIKLQELSYIEYTKYIYHVEDEQKKSWQKSTYLNWAEESQKLRSQVYSFKQKKYWEWSYNYKNIKTLNKRLLMAGVRLGGLLNRIFEERR